MADQLDPSSLFAAGDGTTADPLDPSPMFAAGDDEDVVGHGSADGCDHTERCTYNANCPSAIFAHDLKSYEDSENPVVIGYNCSIMEKKCMQLSSEYDSNLDLDIIVRELFQSEEWWKSRDLLSESLTHFGTIRGFTPSIRKGIIICNRSGDKNYARTYRGGGLQTGCPFLFNLKTMHNPWCIRKNTILMNQENLNQGSVRTIRRKQKLSERHLAQCPRQPATIMVGGAVHRNKT